MVLIITEYRTTCLLSENQSLDLGAIIKTTAKSNLKQSSSCETPLCGCGCSAAQEARA
jgi:hypothetical protein